MFDVVGRGTKAKIGKNERWFRPRSAPCSAALARLVVATLLVLIDFVSAHAGRPLAIDDVAPVAAGQLEIELGLHHGLTDGGGQDQR